MIIGETDTLTPTVLRLVQDRVASRLRAKDASLYAFSAAAEECARHFMGWADLASNPPFSPAEVQRIADELVAEGITHVVLVGQGGSTQAPMTVTMYNGADGLNRVGFETNDAMTPVRVREIMAAIDPVHTLFILASKSGTTLEPRVMMGVLRRELAAFVPEAEIPQHLAAITDPGSALEAQARKEGWRLVLPGEPTVGGRFSALSVFGLFPAALVGVDLKSFMARAREAEVRCGNDCADNPALVLAAFLFDNYLAGRSKISFLAPRRARVLGLWIEQLVAESLGKEGKGILPYVESDPTLLARDAGDRTAVLYETEDAEWEGLEAFEAGLACVDGSIPALRFRICSVEDLAEHFIMWEYAIAMCGYLMEVCPFDQPDVADTKARVVKMLSRGLPEPDFTEDLAAAAPGSKVEVRVSRAVREAAKAVGVEEPATLREALGALLISVKPGDYFAMNAFLPFDGEGRREALESIRHDVAAAFGVPGCLEMGPRYLHSTGQLQKGGANEGVFLVLSADEHEDIPLEAEAPSVGSLAKTQAVGDWMALAERGRRAVQVHLPDNTASLGVLAELVRDVLRDLTVTR
ncbi:MAG: glucose-6-phosphate isomerase [Eggerthellaceae bacterium]|nr:glucose-6-phosphate isomerase [Eggerthellaceae bacterium]